MRIDSSQFRAFCNCPRQWQEVYRNRVQRKPTGDGKDFGKAVHERLEDHFVEQGRNSQSLRPEYIQLERGSRASSEAAFGSEVDEMMAAYAAHYPTEEFEVIDVERSYVLNLPNSSHEASGKLDAVVRANSSATTYQVGKLYVLEHKSEKRGSSENDPEGWASRPQVSIYQWAGEQLYGESIEGAIIDVLTRRSPGKRLPPTFRRYTASRTAEQIREVLASLDWAATTIEAMAAKYGDDPWPANFNACKRGYFRCDFFAPHIYGWTPEMRAKDFMEAEDYLGTHI